MQSSSGKATSVRAQMRESGVPRAREARRGGEPKDVELGMPLEQRRQPLVRVLVDDDDAEPSVRLPAQRVQQSRRLGGAADGADDEVPGREGRAAHRE